MEKHTKKRTVIKFSESNWVDNDLVPLLVKYDLSSTPTFMNGFYGHEIYQSKDEKVLVVVDFGQSIKIGKADVKRPSGTRRTRSGSGGA